MNDPLPLILVGGGGHCRSVIDAALSAGLEIRGILEAPGTPPGGSVLGIPVVGTDADIASFVADCAFVVTLGGIKSMEPRRRLFSLIESSGGRHATVIASTARVSPFASIGEGSVVLHGACVNAGASIGRGAIINTLACIEHDASIGDFCHISTCAAVNGGAWVGERSFVGSNATLAQGVTVASGTVIGAAAFVNKDIISAGTYAGVPAKPIHPSF